MQLLDFCGWLPEHSYACVFWVVNSVLLCSLGCSEWLVMCCYAVARVLWVLTYWHKWKESLWLSVLWKPLKPLYVLRRVSVCQWCKCMISLSTVCFSAYIRTLTETEADLRCVYLVVSVWRHSRMSQRVLAVLSKLNIVVFNTPTDCWWRYSGALDVTAT